MNRITDAAEIAEAAAQATADGELLSRFLNGRDDRAFAELVARHGPMVFGVCLRRLGQCQDAEDCFQAVFLALARHGRKLEGRQTVGPWLYTVARQVSTKALRSRSRRRWVLWGNTPEPGAEAPVEAAVDLDAALASLAEPERSAVVLCHLEGLSRTEAAQTLAIPEGTLSARLARALEKLRRKLGKPPMAVLAAAAVVILPEALPAASVGLVRHLQDGTLDDWAAPRVLDLYRRVTPMRLLNRFGSPAAALAAALLILVGAATGYVLAAQPPNGDNPKKNFAAVVEEAQRQTTPGESSSTAVVQIDVNGRVQGDGRGSNHGSWDIRISEVINGERVEHRTSTWPAIVPLLKQIVDGGAKTIAATIGPGPATRLDANQLINDCKRAGFKTVEYRGPALFLGVEDDSRAWAGGDLAAVQVNIDLTPSKEFLPDWMNHWAVLDKAIVHLGDKKVEVTPALEKALKVSGGVFGPAAELSEALENAGKADTPPNSTKSAAATELAQQIEAQQRRAGGAQTTMTLEREGTAGPDPGQHTSLIIHQRFRRGEAETTTLARSALGPLAGRVARYAAERIDVRIGRTGGSTAAVNPLQLNAVLNACRRAGLKEVYYTGQKIFTGSEDQTEYSIWPGRSNSLPIVKIVLSLRDLDGDLPDESTGWVEVVAGPQDLLKVLKASERERFLESLRAKAKAGKAMSPESRQALKKVEDELSAIDEELAYWKYRLKPTDYERSAHVQSVSQRKAKLEEQRKSVEGQGAKQPVPPAWASSAPPTSDRKLTTYPLKNTAASDIVEVLKRTSLGKSSDVSISADTRMNAVLISASQDKQAALVKAIGAIDDLEPPLSKRKNFEYRLHKSAPTDVIEALRRTELGRTGGVAFVADEGTNSVLLSAPSDKAEALLKAIQALDELGAK